MAGEEVDIEVPWLNCNQWTLLCWRIYGGHSIYITFRVQGKLVLSGKTDLVTHFHACLVHSFFSFSDNISSYLDHTPSMNSIRTTKKCSSLQVHNGSICCHSAGRRRRKWVHHRVWMVKNMRDFGSGNSSQRLLLLFPSLFPYLDEDIYDHSPQQYHLYDKVIHRCLWVEGGEMNELADLMVFIQETCDDTNEKIERLKKCQRRRDEKSVVQRIIAVHSARRRTASKNEEANKEESTLSYESMPGTWDQLGTRNTWHNISAPSAHKWSKDWLYHNMKKAKKIELERLNSERKVCQQNCTERCSMHKKDRKRDDKGTLQRDKSNVRHEWPAPSWNCRKLSSWCLCLFRNYYSAGQDEQGTSSAGHNSGTCGIYIYTL